ncbi:MAG: hypothetical protein IPK46_03985 [Saprospiraceae bacterium]|nr:hypothetical protein [Saprospiraceae bacterium]
MDSLMSRINPIFCSMVSIPLPASPIQTAKKEAMALQLAEFYKYASNRGKQDLHYRSRGTGLVGSVPQSRKMRFGDMIAFQSEVDENARSFMFLTCYPTTIENAIKYGYHATTGKTEISLQIKHTGTHLVIKVYDGGRPLMNLYSTASASTASTENWKYRTAMIMNCNLSMVPKNMYFYNSPSKQCYDNCIDH